VLSIGTILVLIRQDLSTKLSLADTAALALPLALAVCKLGCLASGCCGGFEGAGPLFIRSPWVSPDSSSCDKRLFPTQLLDAAIFVACWGVLMVLRHRERAKGLLLLWFVLLASAGRFLSEFTSGRKEEGVLLGLTLTQVLLFLALPVALLSLRRSGIYHRMLEWRSARAPGVPEAAADEERGLRLIARRQILVLLLAMLAFPLAPLLVFVGVLWLVVGGIGRIQHPSSEGHRARFMEGITYATAGTMFVTGFMLADVRPAIVAGAALLGMAVWLYGEEPARLGQ